MKRKFLFVVLAVSIPVNLHAAIDWDIYGGTEAIGDGDNYGIVRVYDEASLSITGGYIDHLTAYGTSDVDIFSLAGLTTVVASENSDVNIYGGNFSGLQCEGSATLNIYKAESIQGLHYVSPGDFIVNIYGYDFSYMGSGSSGWLSGYWSDDSAFTVYLRSATYPTENLVLHEIPEPISAYILTFAGMLLLGKRRQYARG